MARIVVDKHMCMGHARCNAVAPDLFPLDDDGFVEVDAAEVDESERGSAETGARSCPERAIQIER